MTKRLQSDIDSLTAPTADGEILIWPEAGDLVSLAEKNRRRRERDEFMLLDRPAHQWRSDGVEAGLVFMSGHQPDFFHAGVWAKNVVTSVLAGRTGGAARFLVVDSDVPDRIAIQWPDNRGEYCRMRSALATASVNRQSYEYLTDRSSLDFGGMFRAIPETMRSDDAPMGAFENGFMQPRADDDRGGEGYVDRWTAGVRSIEEGIGVPSPGFLRISQVFGHGANRGNESAAAFVAHLFLQARAFAAAYNHAIANYRERRGIRGQQHPIPDLVATDDRVEVPFWALHAGESRQRLSVSWDEADRITLWVGADKVCNLGRDELRAKPRATLEECLNPWQVRPRALAQTMYARLFTCDLFVHGIGGAKYDQITDDIIRVFFGVEPPAYAAVSATMWLPLKRFGIRPSDLRIGRHKARDLRYNPQRYLVDGGDVQVLKAIIERREQAIRDSERLRAERRRDRAARRVAYDQIHRANTDLLNAVPEIAVETDRSIAEISARLDHDKVTKSREWFFALHPKARLIRLHGLLKDKLGD
ncbi:MAG: hypothetical protein MI923_15690 [Phycisphaerales bacterium]|nr:hypothetical protein [Phycisphaerales bacterium]